MHDRGKSDGPVVPEKLPNNAQGGAAEAVEGSGPAKGNAASKTRSGLSAGHSALKWAWIACAEWHATDKEARFTALLHHVDVERLRAAYWALEPKAAPGVDGVTWADYGQDLEENLRDLHARVHRGGYRARPSRRVFIPKPDGRLRPLGVAALEDKILQRAVVEVLNSVYEADFLGFSYGFRPGRSPHQALDALAVGIQRRRVNWVLDTDFRDYFSSLDHRWLEQVLGAPDRGQEGPAADPEMAGCGGHRGRGVDGVRRGRSARGFGFTAARRTSTCTTSSTYGLTSGERRHARGDVVIVRFADDAVVGFEHRDDAERFWADLRDRLAKFSLELNAEKTRLIEFGRFAAERRKARGLGKPETFRFLGFTHVCGKTRKGRFKLKRITDSKRMRAKLQRPQRQDRARPASAHSRARALARQRPARALPVLRGARQQRGATRLPLPGRAALAQGASASQPAHHGDLGADVAPR